MSISKSEGFNSRWGFLLTAMGSAIGLGNIWRFPITAYENGGGAFLIPYLVALLTAGIPLLILEFNLGNKFRGSAPQVFKRLHPKLEWIGWWQTFICFIIPTFYSVVIAWIIYYVFQSITLGWGNNPSDFFNHHFLQISEKPPEEIFQFGGINILISTLVSLVWLCTAWVLILGIKRGIERVNKIMVPTLLAMFLLVVAYSLSLPHAIDGLQQFFKPQWHTLSNPQIWISAYAQVFFSTSIACGIMITYSAYTARDSDLNTNGIITGLGNSSVELAAGIGVFAALGFLAHQQALPIDQVAKGGPGLIFTIYPSILNQLPRGINGAVGLIFYLSLLFAGFSSLLSLVEVVVSAIREKFNIPRKLAVILVIIPLYFVSLLITTNAGIYLLDIIDHFVSTFGIVPSGLFEIVGVVLVAILTKRIKEIVTHGNKYSKVKTPVALQLTLLCGTGILLTYLTINGLINEFKQPYENYPRSFHHFWGWGVVVVLTLGAILFTRKKNNE